MLTQMFKTSAAVIALTLAANSWAAQTWTVNFKDSDIQEVIKFVADVTGKTVVIDPRVKGRVKVISSKPLNEDELIDLFRTVLEVHDFSVVEVGDVLRIIPLKDARSSPVPVVDKTTKEKGFLTQVIQLQNIAAAKVLPSIRPLVPQHSHLSAYDPSNAIIITDTAENIARIRSLIEMLDKSATPITEVIELKYANAADLVQVLDAIDKQSDQNRRSPQNAINLTADKRNNAILVTGEDLQRQRIKSLIVRLDRPTSQTGNVRVVYLEYADAKTAAETLTKVMANLSKMGPPGAKDAKTAATVEADEDTNALLITAEGDQLQTLLTVVERLDVRRPQVLIDAIIVEVSGGADSDLGVEWLFSDRDNGTFGRAGGRTDIGTIANGIGADVASDSENPTGLLTALAQATGTTLGILGSNNDNDFLAVIKAIESNAKTNILSTPTILTMNNHEASFVVGKNIPILTGSTQTGTGGTLNPFQTYNREDVGIKLTVTPQVNEGDTILLDIQQEVSSLEEGSQSTASGAITNQREIQTQVLAANGEIVVLGGLIQDDIRYGESRVPVLGRIPILGRLFRSTKKTKSRSNLMVFLRVTVIRDDDKLKNATAEKYDYIRQQQMEQQDQGFLRLKQKDFSILPEIEYYNTVDKLIEESQEGEPVDMNKVQKTPSAQKAVKEAEQ